MMDTFPQFSCFPAEIRRHVWMFCLPRRIMEEDVPYTLFYGGEGRQACWPNTSSFQNARVPLISAVCAEARDVVFEWGHHQLSRDVASMASIWVQPKIDRVCHLNWNRGRHYHNHAAYYSGWPPEESPVASFVSRAQNEFHLPASFDAELFLAFDLGKLMGSPLTGSRAFEAHHPRITLHTPFDLTLQHFCEFADILASGSVIYATMVAISLHVRRESALSSGLFGLLGDATVQTFNYDDISELGKYHALFRADHSLMEAEPHVERLFSILLSTAFHQAVHSWEAKVRWKHHAAIFKKAWLNQDFAAFRGTDPKTAWTPPLPAGKTILYMRPEGEERVDTTGMYFEPNKDHFWWSECAEKYMPRIVPQVMIRLCDNQCYKKERRPKAFGKVGEGDEHPGHLGTKINERGWLVPRDS